jgi:hypothetical protein
MNWYLFVALFLPAWLWQNTSHELSHLWSGYLWEGRKPLKLIFWPHKYKGKFYFARYESGEATQLGSESHRHIAPLWWAIRQQFSFLVVIVALIITGYPDWVYMLPFFICPTVDALVWVWRAVMMRPGTDGMRYRTVTNKGLFDEPKTTPYDFKSFKP